MPTPDKSNMPDIARKEKKCGVKPAKTLPKTKEGRAIIVHGPSR